MHRLQRNADTNAHKVPGAGIYTCAYAPQCKRLHTSEKKNTHTHTEETHTCSHLLDALADFSHSVGVRVRALQKPAVPTQHLASLVPGELDEAFTSVHDRVVRHLRVRHAEARLAGLERLDQEEPALVQQGRRLAGAVGYHRGHPRGAAEEYLADSVGAPRGNDALQSLVLSLEACHLRPEKHKREKKDSNKKGQVGGQVT